MKDRLQSDILRAASTWDKQMAGGKHKHKNISNRKEGYFVSTEPNYPTIASPGYTITPEKQDMGLKITSHNEKLWKYGHRGKIPKQNSNGLCNKIENQKKLDLIKLQSFCKLNDTLNKIKRPPTDWESIFTNSKSVKGLMSSVCVCVCVSRR